jgi:hypothetical protein
MGPVQRRRSQSSDVKSRPGSNNMLATSAGDGLPSTSSSEANPMTGVVSLLNHQPGKRDMSRNVLAVRVGGTVNPLTTSLSRMPDTDVSMVSTRVE